MLISSAELSSFYAHQSYYRWKILLFYILWGVSGYLVTQTSFWPLKLSIHIFIGFLMLGILTFMHDAVHGILFKSKLANDWVGNFMMLPFWGTFITFKEDHLKHHQHTRTLNDPDRISPVERSFMNYLIFYLYFFLGAFLSMIHFNFIYPFKEFRGKKLKIHLISAVLYVAVYVIIFSLASIYHFWPAVLDCWLIPLIFFGIFNSWRFVPEHYGVGWDTDLIHSTRTITSNRFVRFFWNNINYHIEHHMYPAVPWYNLPKLHKALSPVLKERGAIVEKSYFRVCLRALLQGPEPLESHQH